VESNLVYAFFVQQFFEPNIVLVLDFRSNKRYRSSMTRTLLMAAALHNNCFSTMSELRQVVVAINATISMKRFWSTAPVLLTALLHPFRTGQQCSVECALVLYRSTPMPSEWSVRESRFTRSLGQFSSWLKTVPFGPAGHSRASCTRALQVAARKLCDDVNVRRGGERHNVVGRHVILVSDSPPDDVASIGGTVSPGSLERGQVSANEAARVPLADDSAHRELRDVLALIRRENVMLSTVSPRCLEQLDRLFVLAIDAETTRGGGSRACGAFVVPNRRDLSDHVLYYINLHGIPWPLADKRASELSSTPQRAAARAQALTGLSPLASSSSAMAALPPAQQQAIAIDDDGGDQVMEWRGNFVWRTNPNLDEHEQCAVVMQLVDGTSLARFEPSTWPADLPIAKFFDVQDPNDGPLLSHCKRVAPKLSIVPPPNATNADKFQLIANRLVQYHACCVLKPDLVLIISSAEPLRMVGHIAPSDPIKIATPLMPST
jgi:Mediator complex subunit 25 von Willebrand factor type A